MRIKSVEIGKDFPCRIVAELGTLHHHSYDSLMRATEQAVECGVDMVKIQIPYFYNVKTCWWANETALKRYKNFGIDIKGYCRYFKMANDLGETPVFASVFESDDWDGEIVSYLPAVKLGYKANFMPRLRKMAYSAKKPLIMSCADAVQRGLVLDEIADMEKKEKRKIEIKFLFVQPLYPTPVALFSWPPRGEAWDGVSCHLPSRLVIDALREKSRFMQLVELHVMGDDARGPDAEFALTMRQLKEAVDIAHDYITT